MEFDYLCCINLPQADGTMKRIYLDVEIQNVENPGYALLTRGNDYLSRRLSVKVERNMIIETMME